MNDCFLSCWQSSKIKIGSITATLYDRFAPLNTNCEAIPPRLRSKPTTIGFKEILSCKPDTLTALPFYSIAASKAWLLIGLICNNILKWDIISPWWTLLSHGIMALTDIISPCNNSAIAILWGQALVFNNSYLVVNKNNRKSI